MGWEDGLWTRATRLGRGPLLRPSDSNEQERARGGTNDGTSESRMAVSAGAVRSPRRKWPLDLLRLTAGLVAACFLLEAGASAAQLRCQPTGAEEAALRTFLEGFFKAEDVDPATRYQAAFVRLKDDGSKEILVSLSGEFFWVFDRI